MCEHCTTKELYRVLQYLEVCVLLLREIGHICIIQLANRFKNDRRSEVRLHLLGINLLNHLHATLLVD